MSAQERRIVAMSDVIAMVVCAVVVAAVVLPMNPGGIFGRTRGHSRRMQNGTQVRGIQQSLVLFSTSNNGYYPGYNSDGNDDLAAIPASTTQWGANALHDDDIGKVYAILLTGEFFTPEYIISPREYEADAAEAAADGTFAVIDNTHYSYALLDMNDSPSNRRSEWKDTNNSQVPMVVDPSSDIRPMFFVTYHTDVPSIANSDIHYQGNFAWNDNHVTFENQALFPAGTLKVGSNLSTKLLNPFKTWNDDDVKFIW